MGQPEETAQLSPWWRHTVILVMIAGFAVLSYVTYRTYTDAPPIPARVEDASGRTLFTSAEILRGQEVFLKYGLMEHGTLWGHGAYLGPDYSADTLHEAVEVGRDTLARLRYGQPLRRARGRSRRRDRRRRASHSEGEPLRPWNRHPAVHRSRRWPHLPRREPTGPSSSRVPRLPPVCRGTTSASAANSTTWPRISRGPRGRRSPTGRGRTTPTPTTGPTTRPRGTRPAARRTCGAR